MKDLFTETTNITEKVNTNQQKDISCTWIEMLNIAKMSTYPKQSTDPIQSLSKQMVFCRTTYPKTHIETQKT